MTITLSDEALKAAKNGARNGGFETVTSFIEALLIGGVQADDDIDPDVLHALQDALNDEAANPAACSTLDETFDRIAKKLKIAAPRRISRMCSSTHGTGRVRNSPNGPRVFTGI